MAIGMGSEMFQLLKEHQEAWTNIWTAVLTKLESIERRSAQTDAAAHSVENNMISFNPEDEARIIQAEPTPFSDRQSAEELKCTSGNVLSFPESDQQPEIVLSESCSTDGLYLNNSKTFEENPTIQIPEQGTQILKEENSQTMDEHVAIRTEDCREEGKHAPCENPPFDLTGIDQFKAHMGFRFIFLHMPYDNLRSSIKIPLELPVFYPMLSGYVRMQDKLDVRQLHRIHQPHEVGRMLGLEPQGILLF